MDIKEINIGIDLVINHCDTTPEQQFIKGVLLALRGAIEMNRQGALHNYVSAFSAQEIASIRQLRNQQEASRN
jgi:hypothetical protein